MSLRPISEAGEPTKQSPKTDNADKPHAEEVRGVETSAARDRLDDANAVSPLHAQPHHGTAVQSAEGDSRRLLRVGKVPRHSGGFYPGRAWGYSKRGCAGR